MLFSLFTSIRKSTAVYQLSADIKQIRWVSASSQACGPSLWFVMASDILFPGFASQRIPFQNTNSITRGAKLKRSCALLFKFSTLKVYVNNSFKENLCLPPTSVFSRKNTNKGLFEDQNFNENCNALLALQGRGESFQLTSLQKNQKPEWVFLD